MKPIPNFALIFGRESHKKHGFIRNMRSLGFKETRAPKTREAQWAGLTLKSTLRKPVKDR